MVIPFHGQGHLFPCIELCKRLAARGLTIKIVADPLISATLRAVADQSSSSGLRMTVIELESEEEEEKLGESGPYPDYHHDHRHHHMQQQLKAMEAILQKKLSAPPLCIIGDVMLGWIPDLCKRFDIPRVSFVTSGACSMAFEHAILKHRNALDQLHHVNDNQTAFVVPGFPSSITISPSDLQHVPPSGGAGLLPPPPQGSKPNFTPPLMSPPPPPPPGLRSQSPPWMNGVKDCVGILVNTCGELEFPFIEYTEKELEKPIWAAGPFLPFSSFWNQSEPCTAITHDSVIRNRKSSIDEDRCLE